MTFSVLDSLPSASREHLDRALHVRLEDDGQLLDLALLDLVKSWSSDIRAWLGARPRAALLLGAELGDAARLRLVLDHLEHVAGVRQVVEAGDLDRRRGAGLLRPAAPRSSLIARTRPQAEPETKTSPTFSVPFCTSTVATGPRPTSLRASSTAPCAGDAPGWP